MPKDEDKGKSRGKGRDKGKSKAIERSSAPKRDERKDSSEEQPKAKKPCQRLESPPGDGVGTSMTASRSPALSVDDDSQASEASVQSQELAIPKKSNPLGDYLNPQARAFFKKIATIFAASDSAFQKQQVNFIVVAHTVPDIFEFLEALNALKPGSKVHTLILKSSAADTQVKETLDTFCQGKAIQVETVKFAKEQLTQRPQLGVDLVKQAAPCVILDIGGYFAPCLESFVGIHAQRPSTLLGIVEDTENGHQKYEKALQALVQKGIKCAVPIFSVARSELKETEDFHVGKSIVDNTVTILGRMGLTLESFECIGVLGCGKIGRSIAQHLRDKKIKKLLVYDIRADRLVQAASLGFPPGTREQVLSTCSMIFSATGDKALAISKDLEQMGRGITYIASCTSHDDEFDLRYTRVPDKVDHNGISCLEFTKGKKTVCFLAEGNAINFYLHANPIGNFIRAVQAGIIVSSLGSLHHSQTADVDSGQIQVLTKREQDTIFKIWLESFVGIRACSETNVSLEVDASGFYGREKELVKISTKFFSRQDGKVMLLNLHGGMGIGKTELVSEFVRKNYARYDFIWWIDVQGNKDGAYKQLAEKLKISTAGKERAELMRDIFRELHSGKNFLLIYDNVQNRKDIDELRQFAIEQESSHEEQPAYQHVMCISCDRVFKREHAVLRVNRLSDDDAYELVTRQVSELTELRCDQERVKELIRTLVKAAGKHPLLLDKLSKCLSMSITKSSSLDELKTTVGKLCEFATKGRTTQDKLGYILSYVLNEIRETFRDERYRQLLLVCALLDGAHMEAQMLYEIADRMKLSKKTAKKYLKEFANYGLISKSKKNSRIIYHMHNAMKIAIINQLQPEGLKETILPKIVDVLYKGFDYRYYEFTPEKLDACEEYIPHIKALLSRQDIRDHIMDSDNGVKLMCRFASFYLNEYRDYERSLEYYTLLYDKLKKAPDCNKNIVIAIALQGMAANRSKIYSNKASKDKAPKDRKLLEQACKDAEQGIKIFNEIAQGAEFDGYPVILYKANMLITLGYVHRLHGHSCEELDKKRKYFRDAEEELRQAITALDSLSPEKPAHTEAATSASASEHVHFPTDRANSLAMHTLGNIILDVCKKVLIPSGAQAGDIKKKLMEAKKYLEKAIVIRRTSHPQHPDLASSLQKLAKIRLVISGYDESNREQYLQKALKSCREALEIQSKIFSPEHPDLKRTSKTLSKIQARIEGLQPKRQREDEPREGDGVTEDDSSETSGVPPKKVPKKIPEATQKPPVGQAALVDKFGMRGSAVPKTKTTQVVFSGTPRI